MAIRALALVSGGLDGLLAVRWLERQGIHVVGLHFRTGFVHRAREVWIDAARAKGELPGSGAARLDVVDLREAYLRLVREPRHGYGSGLNPCLDCRVLMLRTADAIARERGIELLATGDVLGQRAMEQSRHALERIDAEAGVAGRVLRPLSAALLEPCDAERAGTLDRSTFLRLHGRARRAQERLREELECGGCPASSGGCCRLADRHVARRMRDLLSRSESPGIHPDAIALLDRGRHFRLGHALKAVVARNEEESRWLTEHAGERWTCRAADGHGAVVLVDGECSGRDLDAIAGLAATYSRSSGAGCVAVELRRCAEPPVSREGVPIDPDRVADWRI
ncbi:MAG: hypothetical protein GY716_05530 [bacterium]|nr:hypothetical protein [bacterium]